MTTDQALMQRSRKPEASIRSLGETRRRDLSSSSITNRPSKPRYPSFLKSVTKRRGFSPSRRQQPQNASLQNG